MPEAVKHEELVGLHCPQCGEPIGRQYIAKSYPMPGGQYRRRVCGNCLADVECFETVRGANVQMFVVNGISGHQLGALRQMVKAMGGKVATH